MFVRVITNQVRRSPEGRVLGINPDANESKRIDWNNSSDRKWLMSHMHWGMHNDREVSIYPESN
jgi:hypothetical protein